MFFFVFANWWFGVERCLLNLNWNAIALILNYWFQWNKIEKWTACKCFLRNCRFDVKWDVIRFGMTKSVFVHRTDKKEIVIYTKKYLLEMYSAMLTKWSTTIYLCKIWRATKSFRIGMRRLFSMRLHSYSMVVIRPVHI